MTRAKKENRIASLSISKKVLPIILTAMSVLMLTLLASPKVHAAVIDVTSDTDEWYEGNTYYVRNDVTVRYPIRVNGKVAVYIMEGATLTAARGIQVNQGNKLDIQGKGKLITTGDPGASGAGIGPRYGNPGGDIEINVQPGSSVTSSWASKYHRLGRW